MLDKMKAMVKEKDICVLATVSGNKPYCSLIAYATNDEGTEIYMVSHQDTQKYRNLTDNPELASIRVLYPKSLLLGIASKGNMSMLMRSK